MIGRCMRRAGRRAAATATRYVLGGYAWRSLRARGLTRDAPVASAIAMTAAPGVHTRLSWRFDWAEREPVMPGVSGAAQKLTALSHPDGADGASREVYWSINACRSFK